MSESQNPLETNTIKFAIAVRDFAKLLPMTVSNVEDLKNLVRSSGHIGALYISAVGAPNRNDYLIRLKSCITETRTTHYWLGLVDTQGTPELEHRRHQLQQAAQELAGVFGKVIESVKATP